MTSVNVEIIPAILAKDFNDVRQKIKAVEGHAEWVQLDVGDGKFTAMETWQNPEDLKQISTPLSLEAHLMMSEPEKEIDRWIASGVKRILIHIESTEKLPEILEKIKKSGLAAGLVLNLQTPIDVLNNVLISQYPNVKIIQLMGISEIGYYGHPFDERVIPKIMALRDKYGLIKIAVDGGINIETAKKAIAAGADTLVAGSAIFGKPDVGQTIEELKKSLN